MSILFHIDLFRGSYQITSLDYLIERIWEKLGLVKVYTKKRGARPDLSDPVCLRKGATIEVSNFAIVTFIFVDISVGCMSGHSQITGFELPLWACLVSKAIF